jgi:hypothetical protein
VKSVLGRLWLWFASRQDLVQHIKILQRRLERKDDELLALKEQRDTCLETLDRLRWRQRDLTARHMTNVNHLGKQTGGQ